MKITGILILCGLLIPTTILCIDDDTKQLRGSNTIIDNREVLLNTDCDVGPDSLTSAHGVSIPQTCISGDSSKGYSRCFYTYVPSCANNTIAPLVYDIHGWKFCPLLQSTFSGWKELADEKCFVLVWPTGNIRRKDGMNICWNVRGGLSGLDPISRRPTTNCCCGGSLPNTDNDDSKFLKEIAVYVVRDVPIATNRNVQIDTRRIYMTGHSNGCMVSLSVAMQHNFTTAIACFAGALLTPNLDNYKPLPIWMVHGEDDRMIRYDGMFLIEKYPSIEATHKYLSELNQCKTYQRKEFLFNSTDSLGYSDVSTSCKNEASVEIITLNGVDHFPFSRIDLNDCKSWPLKPTKNGRTMVDTTRIAWEFLEKYISSEDLHLQ